MQNQTNSTITVSGGASQLTFAPRGLLMHPGKNGECAVIRLTVPYIGWYRVAGRFYAVYG